MSRKLSASAAASRKNKNVASKSKSSASVLDKLQMLRSFCGTTWSEKDLSSCLSQSGYSVELAAERLMTGQYKPSHQQPSSVFATSRAPIRSSQNSSTKGTATSSSTSTSQPTNTKTVDIVTPSHSEKKKKRPVPSETASRTESESSLRSVTPKTPKLNHPSSTTGGAPSNKRQSSVVESSWLLCQRWISNGTCTQRNGGVDYKEILEVEHCHDGPPMLRFRGRCIVGQFPKHISYMLVPLLRINAAQDSTPVVILSAEALMEERNLNIGSDVAFSLSVWLPNPKAFFDLFEQAHQMPAAAASQFFQRKKEKAVSQGTTLKVSRPHEAAFALLQWAQEGENYTFPTTDSADNDIGRGGESPKAGGNTSGSDGEAEEEEDNVDNVADTVENEEAPEWARSVTAATEDSMLPEFDAASVTPILKNVELRPYQRQALRWMMQRELPPSESSQEDLQKQLDLLVELTTTSLSPSKTVSEMHRPQDVDVHCDCGPVIVSERAATCSQSIDGGNLDDAAAIATHPLWERRYLASYDRTRTMSFYVQPLFLSATAVAPEPPHPCRGGILADSMGLGKTVMLLSLICQSKHEDDRSKANIDSSGPHDSDKLDRGGNTTLVVAPLSLLAQWEEELETKSSLSYFAHYGDKKLNDYSAIDVVVTTYGTIQGELQAQLKKKKVGQADDIMKMPGLLGMKWKRLILDECHSIKNNSTIVSRACCLLRAERRWCVSGTIIQNSLDDVYALLKFLRHEPWCERSFWKTAVLNESDMSVALDRVRRVLSPIMLRRTKESRDSNGKPILTLPPIETKAITVNFTLAERQFYDELHLKSLNLFQGFVKAGTASKSWLAIFSLLHRLRQACDHVALTVKAHLNEDDWNANIIAKSSSEEAVDATSEEKKISGDTIDDEFLNHLIGQFRSMQSKSGENNRQRSDNEKDDYASKVAKMLNNAVAAKSSHLNDECSICLEQVDLQQAVVTPCYHIFCGSCLVSVLSNKKSSYFGSKEKSTNKSMGARPNGPCPVCTKEVESSKILKLEIVNGRATTSYLMDSMKSNHRDHVAGNSESETASGARQVLEEAIQGSNSSKQLAILKELQNVWDVDPGSKVLVFSQFLGFLDLLEHSFRANGIPFSRLDGKLSLKERVKVLEEFGNTKPTNIPQGLSHKNIGSVLLISMKAGGVGLNLVAARTVFIADPWWNAAVEDQCVNRIHRIGQTAEMVRVRKFYVSNSVEERILLLQKRKKDMASEVLRDGGTGQADGSGMRPTLDDFKILFKNE